MNIKIVIGVLLTIFSVIHNIASQRYIVCHNKIRTDAGTLSKNSRLWQFKAICRFGPAFSEIIAGKCKTHEN